MLGHNHVIASIVQSDDYSDAHTSICVWVCHYCIRTGGGKTDALLVAIMLLFRKACSIYSYAHDCLNTTSTAN